MTSQPGRDLRRAQQHTKRIAYLRSRAVDHVLFLVVLTLFAVAAIGHVLPVTIMTTWIVTLVFLASVQFTFSKQTEKASSSNEHTLNGATELMLAGLILSGVAWGLMGLYVVSRDGLAEQFLVVALMSSLLIYAVTHVAAVFGAFTLYVCVVAAPCSVFLILSSSALSRTLGAAFIILVSASLIGGWRHYQVLCRAARLDIEADELHGVLNKLKSRLERQEL